MSSTLALSSLAPNRANALLKPPPSRRKTIMSFVKPPFSYSTLSAVASASTSATSNSSCNWRTKAVLAGQHHRRKRMMICSCEVALSSSVDQEKEEDASPSAASSLGTGTDDSEAAKAKIGARVRVEVPLKVYHVPRAPEIDLTGMEGVLKQYAGLWKGKHISANLPFKVEFVTHVEGRGPVKFFAHLKDDEFTYID